MSLTQVYLLLMGQFSGCFPSEPEAYSDALCEPLDSVSVPAGVEKGGFTMFNRVTIHIVPNLSLTSEQKFRFSMRPMY